MASKLSLLATAAASFLVVTVISFGVSHLVLMEQAHRRIADLKELRTYYGDILRESAPHTTAVSGAQNLPVPTKFMMGYTSFSKQGGDGLGLSIYSPFPLSEEAANRKNSPFAISAWTELRRNPEGRSWSIDAQSLSATLHVAEADVMSEESCVSCHNAHPLASKTDWAVGDVRGIIEASVDLTQPALYSTLAGALAMGAALSFRVGSRAIRRRLQAAELAARRDPLTSLWNRRRFDEDTSNMHEALFNDRRAHFLLFIAVDDFSQLPKDSGNAVLKTVAHVLASGVRPQDTVYRFDETRFAIMFVGIDPDTCVTVAERLRRAIAKVQKGNSLPQELTASLAATRLQTGEPMESAIKYLEGLLGQAAQFGGNRVMHEFDYV